MFTLLRSLLRAPRGRRAYARSPFMLVMSVMAALLAVGASATVAAPAQAAPTHQSAPTRSLAPLKRLGSNGPLPALSAVVSGGPDLLDMFATTENPFVPSQIYGAGWNGAAWSQWETVGGADTATAPVYVTYGQNSLAVFSEYQGQLQEVSGAGAFPNWVHSATDLHLPFATSIMSGPGATSWGGGRLDVFAWSFTRFSRYLYWQNLLHEWSTDGGASWQYETLPTFSGFISGLAPVVVSRGANDLTVLAFGTNDSLSALTWNGSSWGNWQSLGGYLPSQRIAAQPLAGNQLHVFGVGGNASLYDDTLTGSSWSGWQSLGGTVTTSPTASSWAYDSMTVCALSSDNALWCRDDIYGSWSGWYSLGGSFASGLSCGVCANYYYTDDPPVSASSDLGTFDVFAQTLDLKLWQNEGSWDVYGGWWWGGWVSLGNPPY